MNSDSPLSHLLAFKNVIIFSIVLRVALIFYSEWHDAHSVLKYTDIDYHVFSDAARYLLTPWAEEVGKPANLAQGVVVPASPG